MMRLTSLFFTSLIAGVLIFSSACNKDNGPSVDPAYTVINHDDDNQDAPSLPVGTYEAGVRFLNSRMAAFDSASLEQIQYYVMDVPRSAEIKVYSMSNGDAPRTLLYSTSITSEINADSWMTHTLNNPITLDGEDLWVCIRFSQTAQQRTIGCDPGPAVANGDWLWDQLDNDWLPLSQRSATNINWNIRALVRE